MGPLEVLTDTMGVDFGPYLQRVLHDVRMNWYNLIPESAQAPIMKKGKVTIEFAILKDGTVAGMKLISTSGDVALDRGAWGGITASNPFPPLPNEFGGQYLALRFAFFYNPDKGGPAVARFPTTPGTDSPSPWANPPCSEMLPEIPACLRPRHWRGTCPESAGRWRPACVWFRRACCHTSSARKR